MENRLAVRKKEIILKVIVYSISIALAIMTLYPFAAMLADFTGFKIKDPSRVLRILPKRGKQFVEFFTSRIAISFVNSIIVTACSTILNVYFSAMTAYSISAYKWKMRKAFSNFIMALMMFPTLVASSGFIHLTYKFHLTNHLFMLILPAIATPISVVFMRLYLDAAFSMELVYSARIDGAGEFRIFNQIVIPILKPAISTQAIFAIVSSWNDLGLPLVILTEENKKTLPIAMILNYALGERHIPIFLSTIPVVIIYLLLARNIVEGVQLGSVKM